jgi:hypothetical protein
MSDFEPYEMITDSKLEFDDCDIIYNLTFMTQLLIGSKLSYSTYLTWILFCLKTG